MDDPTVAVGACQDRISYRFRTPALLVRALTHASLKSKTRPSNERLEFLGDAVIGLAISGHLFQSYPDATEGELTQVKSVVVSARTLSRVAKQLGLESCFLVGKGMANQERLPTSALANLFEAVTAAIYLDGGWDEARHFVLEVLGPEVLRAMSRQNYRNYKSILQQYAQKEMGLTPTYRVIREEGPDHSKRFEVVAVLGAGECEMGAGSTKKDAEQEAAFATLRTVLGPRFEELVLQSPVRAAPVGVEPAPQG